MAHFISTHAVELLRLTLETLIPASILLLCGAFTLLRLWGTSQSLPLPPGRRSLPFLGETFPYLDARKRNWLGKFLQDHVAKYGDIFKTNLMGAPTIMAPNPAGNKLLFTNENKLVTMSWPASLISVVGKRSLISLTGEEAKRVRHAVVTILKPEALQKYTSRLDKCVQRFIKEEWEGKQEIKVHPLMKSFTFSVACELLMSRPEKEEQEMLLEPFITMIKGCFQLPISLPGTEYNKAIAAGNMLRSRFLRWIDERRQDISAGRASNEQDLLSLFLSYRDEDGKPLSDQDIADNILLLLFAGHDTSTVLTTMVCKYLALNPDVFDAVFEENQQLAKEKGANEPLTWTDLQKMKLSWRVVQETMRIQPPISGGFRVAIQDFDYNGFKIPKGWKMHWSTHSTHNNPYYFSNPSKFDPSRFEGKGPAPYTFVPFGGGSRMCPGNEFARMEALVLLHNLVMQFSWTLVDPDETITLDPAARPTKGLPICLEPRLS